MRSTALALALAAPAASGRAAECAGVTLPDEMLAEGVPLVLNGLGLREVTPFGIDVYVAGLYLERPSPDATSILALGQTLRLTLRFVRDVSHAQLHESFAGVFAATPEGEPPLEDESARLQSWLRELAAGDDIVFTYLPATGVRVHVAGQAQGTIEGDVFARRLLADWLGDRPPSAALKAGLLGGECR
jgi:hypothetical protein